MFNIKSIKIILIILNILWPISIIIFWVSKKDKNYKFEIYESDLERKLFNSYFSSYHNYEN